MIGWKKAEIRTRSVGGYNDYVRDVILKVKATGRIVAPEEQCHLGWYNRNGNFTSMYVTKLRAERLEVLEAFRPKTLEPVVLKEGEFITASWDTEFRYTVGKARRAGNFDPNPAEGCSGGLHFFAKRSHAEHFSL